MPGIIDWRSSPLKIVDQIFNENGKTATNSWVANVGKFFSEKLNPSDWYKIPSLNSMPSHSLVDGQIIRFRGMIQDMFDPEIYLDEYEYVDPGTGQCCVATGRFRENTSCNEDEINFNSVATKNEERLSYFCTSIPGEAEWVIDAFNNKAILPQTASSSNFFRKKRGLEDDNSMEDTMEVAETLNTAANKSSPISHVKKTKSENSDTLNDVTSSTHPLASLNKPLSVIVKLYDLEEGALALNDNVEFVGILSLDPNYAKIGFQESASDGKDVNMDLCLQFNLKELEAKNPPSSLVPRIHVLKFVKLDSGNPLLPFLENLTTRVDTNLIRNELHSYLTRLLLGDSLCADYLICHLISKIYLRRDVLCLGKLSVNIFQVPLESSYSKQLSSKLQQLLCRSFYLPLTINNLNKMAYIPKKDYEANRLETGILQLSPHTHLFLDETTLESGQLDAEGVKNLTALGNLISWQKCSYNFSYHTIDFQTDVPCLILSEGRSILPSDIQIQHKPTESQQEDVFKCEPDAEMLKQFRHFISFVRHLVDFTMSEEMQTFVQEDFVQERSGIQGKNMTADDLHSLLVLSRLLALSYGHKTLTEDIWYQAKQMERMRKERIAHLPARRQ